MSISAPDLYRILAVLLRASHLMQSSDLAATVNAALELLHRVRRSRAMSTEGELLWRNLPPLTFATDTVAISAVLEPCYEVGGDAFDYAVDQDHAHLAIYDAVGHGLRARTGTSTTMPLS